MTDGYALNALKALMDLTGSYNRENPWLGVTAAVALLQFDLAAACKRESALADVNGELAQRIVRMEAVIVAAREVVSPNTQSRMSALFALHDAIAALDALP